MLKSTNKQYKYDLNYLLKIQRYASPLELRQAANLAVFGLLAHPRPQPKTNSEVTPLQPSLQSGFVGFKR